jgi:hypothetical protein
MWVTAKWGEARWNGVNSALFARAVRVCCAFTSRHDSNHLLPARKITQHRDLASYSTRRPTRNATTT